MLLKDDMIFVRCRELYFTDNKGRVFKIRHVWCTVMRALFYISPSLPIHLLLHHNNQKSLAHSTCPSKVVLWTMVDLTKHPIFPRLWPWIPFFFLSPKHELILSWCNFVPELQQLALATDHTVGLLFCFRLPSCIWYNLGCVGCGRGLWHVQHCHFNELRYISQRN